MTEHFRTETRDGVLHLVFDRPDKKNALTLAMYEAFTAALADAADDPAVRVALLYGAGDNFTAGNDLADFLQHPPRDEHAPVFQFLRTVSAFPKPLVAAVAGYAIGLGTTILLHCDLAYAAPTARFQMPFVNLGVVPEAASSLLLPLTIGPKRAAELLYFGDPFGAEAAYQMGLVNALVPDEGLLDTATERARVLAQKPPAALRATKALLRQPQATATAETIEREGRHFIERLAEPEAQEAMMAFMEKRAPDFSRFS